MIRNVLVTGGIGYLGGRIARRLLSNGYRVFLTTRYLRQVPVALKEATVLELHLGDPRSLEIIPSGITDIIHLAAPNEIVSSQSPRRAVEETINGTVLLLKWAVSQGIRRFIFMSTAHVYGLSLQGEVTEMTLPRPVHPYAITHRTAEDFVLASFEKGSLEPVVLRLSNGYGAPLEPTVDRWSLLVNDLCRQAVEHQKLVLRSSGLQVRDFVCLSDVEQAAMHILEIPADQVGDGLFNLGGECSMSVFDMAVKIQSRCKEILGFFPDLIRKPPEADESTEELDYRIEKIKKTGFRLTGDSISEIDSTLMLCREAFGR